MRAHLDKEANAKPWPRGAGGSLRRVDRNHVLSQRVAILPGEAGAGKLGNFDINTRNFFQRNMKMFSVSWNSRIVASDL